MTDERPFRLREFEGNGGPALQHARLQLEPARATGTEYTVLIGPNGTGKSALLGGLAHAALSSTPEQWFEASRVVAIANLVSDAFPLKRGGSASPYHYLGLRQGSNTVTTGALTAASTAALLELPLSPRPDLDWRSICMELQMTPPLLTAHYVHAPSGRRDGSPSELQEARRRAEERIADVFGNGDYFDERSKSFSPSRKRPFELDVQDVAGRLCGVLDDIGETLDMGGVLRQVRNATGWRINLDYSRKPSVGQEMFFSQVLRVVSAARSRALVLIDEPETALHPQWQSNFIPILREQVPDGLGMHVLLATHSAFMVGEADSVIAASSQGFTQVKADLGALSIDAITYQVFGASNTGSVIVERDLSMVLEYLSDQISSDVPSEEVEAAARRLRVRESGETELLSEVLREFEDLSYSRRS